MPARRPPWGSMPADRRRPAAGHDRRETARREDRLGGVHTRWQLHDLDVAEVDLSSLGLEAQIALLDRGVTDAVDEFTVHGQLDDAVGRRAVRELDLALQREQQIQTARPRLSHALPFVPCLRQQDQQQELLWYHVIPSLQL